MDMVAFTLRVTSEDFIGRSYDYTSNYTVQIVMVQILLNMVSLQKESSGINVGRLPAMVGHLS